METKLIERRNSLISSLFQGASKNNLAPDQIISATLFVWRKVFKAKGVSANITLPDIPLENRQLSILALSVSFGIDRKTLCEAFDIKARTFQNDLKAMSVALLSSHKLQKQYATFCTDVLYYARWHYQYKC